MKAPYVEGSSDPPRPRVMAACPRGRVVSVDRGTRRPAIELRNHPFRGADLVWWQGRQHESRRYRESRLGPAESETLCMRGRSMSENREIPSASDSRHRRPGPDRSGKACGHNPDVYADGKSDTSVVPRIVGNKARPRAVDGDGGTVLPPRNRKGGAGNPPPGAGSMTRHTGRRTGGREGW